MYQMSRPLSINSIHLGSVSVSLTKLLLYYGHLGVVYKICLKFGLLSIVLVLDLQLDGYHIYTNLTSLSDLLRISMSLYF